jgi:hypothetical protein
MGESDLARMRDAARQEFLDRYTANQNYMKLIDCYEKALSRAVQT